MLLGNQLSDPHELNALQALSRMIGDFLHLNVPVLGGLPRRDRIHYAVSRRRPFTLDGYEPESGQLRLIAQRLLAACDMLEATIPPGQRNPYEPATSSYPSERPRGPVHQSGIEYKGGAPRDGVRDQAGPTHSVMPRVRSR